MNASARIAEIKREVSAIKAAQAIAAGSLKAYQYSATIWPHGWEAGYNNYCYAIATFTPNVPATQVYAQLYFGTTGDNFQGVLADNNIATRDDTQFTLHGVYYIDGTSITATMVANAPGTFTLREVWVG